MLLAPAVAGAYTNPTPPSCPTGATNCTISVQDAGHNDTASTATNTNTTSSQSGVSSASDQSGNTIAPNFDNSAQTTQNATTTTGAVTSNSTGNTGGNSSNDNKSNASNGDQSMGQANTGSSWNTVGGSSSGGNTLSNGPSTSSSDNSGNASLSGSGNSSNTNTTGASKSTSSSGGNTLSNGSTASVGPTTSSSGGNTLASDANNSGGNSQTMVDASTRYQSKTIFIPSVIPGTPPSQLAVGNVIKETSACGPLQQIIRRPVTGTFIGLISTRGIPQGYTDDLAPMTDGNGARIDYRQAPMPGGGYRLFGHQVTMFTTVVGIASSRNIALGGGGTSGSWGQAGMGASSSNQRLVTSIQLRECEIGTLTTTLVEVAPKRIRQ